MSDHPQTNDIAVALRYDGHSAPKVSATGADAIARQIIDTAIEHNIPIYENPELVALLATLKLGDEIPDILYRTIAELICFVYQLHAMTEEEKLAHSTPLPKHD
jgi:flagellar biosynthesis protein